MSEHPLVEIVMQGIADKHWDERTGPANPFTFIDDAKAAIRAVLTFEPTQGAFCQGDEAICKSLAEFRTFLDSTAPTPAEHCYRAMTAALLKEVESE